MKNNEAKKWKWLFPFTLGNILLICVCVLFNLLGRWFAGSLELPLWLDCIGTFLSAVFLGPLGGAVTGALTNVFLNFRASGQIWFAIVNIAGGIAVGRLFPRDRKIAAFPVIATSIYAAFIMVVISTPLNMLFNHGYIGNLWGDALVDMLAPYISAVLPRCFLGELFINVPDKVLSILITMLILYLVRKKKVKKTLPTEASANL
ncbi:MAG: ECF transporter S component [Lachnospiraceae bacterium]|nr:ECF transporter S component [Lachnospiraceae bacterium]